MVPQVHTGLPYPFHDDVTPELGLTLQSQYWFGKWDTIGNMSAKTL